MSTKKLSKKEKSTIYGKNHFKKTIYTTMQKLEPEYALWEKFYIEEKTYEYKNKQRITYWTNECKNCIMKEICCKKRTKFVAHPLI